MNIDAISPELFLLSAAGNGVMVQLTNRRDVSFGATSVFQSVTDGYEHVRWGNADNMPNAMRKLLGRNNQLKAELDTLRDMIFASGMHFMKRTLGDDGKIQLRPYTDTRLEDWAYETQLKRYVLAAINQRVDNGNIFTRFVWDVDRAWFRLEVSDSYVTRIKKPNPKGQIDAYCTNPYFGELQNFVTEDTKTIPAFQLGNPEFNKKKILTIFHAKEDVPGNPFYAYPSWWTAADWIELANMIPLFHKAGIQNGYNIKYLIKMPQDYFDREGQRALEAKEVKDRWGKFSESMKKLLSGTDNVDKALVVKYMRDAMGKAMDSIDVVPLKNEMSDDAYSTISQMANQSIANAVGLLPTLAGVNPGKGNDSGSQIRVMAEYQQSFRSPVPRMLVTETILYAMRQSGFARDIVPVFEEARLTTLDANPTGKEAVVNHAA